MMLIKKTTIAWLTTNLAYLVGIMTLTPRGTENIVEVSFYLALFTVLIFSTLHFIGIGIYRTNMKKWAKKTLDFLPQVKLAILPIYIPILLCVLFFDYSIKDKERANWDFEHK